jgi:hypothetical protein
MADYPSSENMAVTSAGALLILVSRLAVTKTIHLFILSYKVDCQC